MEATFYQADDGMPVNDLDSDYPFDLEVDLEPNLNRPLTFALHSVYRLRFSRWRVPSHKHPFTSCDLLIWDEPGRQWRVLRTTTVGCYHRDTFTREDGRKAALRLMMKTIREHDLKAAIWDCYLTRNRAN